MKDPYQTLEVPRDATAAEIKKAHRKRAKATHPDRAGGDEEAFKQVATAYALLSDAQARAHYDRTGEAPHPAPAISAAEQLILTIFHTVIMPSGNVEDVLGGIRKDLDRKLAKLREDLAAAKEGEAISAAELGRYRLRQGAGADETGEGNLLETAFRQLVINAQRAQASLTAAVETHQEALHHLDLYEDTRPADPGPEEEPGFAFRGFHFRPYGKRDW